MKIALYGRPSGSNTVQVTEQLIQHLQKNDIEWQLHEAFHAFLKPKIKSLGKAITFSKHEEIRHKVDFLFSIGGDGTLLDTILLVRDSGIPIMGINTGRLGFLSSISKDDTLKAIESLEKGHFSLDKRTLLRVDTNNSAFGEINYALNELTVHKKDTSSMITIHAYLNGQFLNSYWADGLIVATPTGSTGYSLSCGGPILMPQSESFVITPIAPHNLNVRPIIVSDKNVISLEVEGRSKRFLATIDSRSVAIDGSVQLAVKKENFCISLVRLNSENFLNTLRNKLMWGLDSRN